MIYLFMYISTLVFPLSDLFFNTTVKRRKEICMMHTSNTIPFHICTYVSIHQ